jgi:hypothetical protein
VIARLHLALIEPEDVVRHLGHQERHWKAGRSAYALTHVWAKENCLPRSIRSILQAHPTFRSAELVDGFLERQVDLGSAGGRARLIFSLSSASKRASRLLRLKEKPASPSANWFRNGSTRATQERRGSMLYARRSACRSNRRCHCGISFCIAQRPPSMKPSAIGQIWPACSYIISQQNSRDIWISAPSLRPSGRRNQKQANCMDRSLVMVCRSTSAGSMTKCR